MSACDTREEHLRLAELRRLSIFGSDPEPAFEELALLAADLLRAPAAAIMFLNHDREWTKAAVGMKRGYGDRDVAFCAHTILRTQPLLVDDARRDPRFADNPHVVDGGVRAYAGAPLRTAAGQNIGTVCIRDFRPRQFTLEDARTLTALAEVVMRELEMRLACSELRRPRPFPQSAELAQMEFLAAFSREMRQPLKKILAIADRLSSADLDSSARTQTSEEIRHDGRGLLDLLGDLLDFSDLELKRDALEIRTCNPGNILRNCVDEIRPLADRCGATVGCEISEEIPELLDTDPGRLRRIVSSLLRNALRCTDRGFINVSAELIPASPMTASILRVDVCQSAPRPAAGPNLNSHKPTPAPVTAGLAVQIARRAANMLGGDVIVTHDTRDIACFRATIPAAIPVQGVDDDTDARMIQEVQPDLNERDSVPGAFFSDAVLGGRKVLIAGDSIGRQSAFTEAFTRVGIQLTCVPNGRHAIGAVMGAADACDPFDMILMDYDMPALDGAAVARELRHLGYTGQILLLCERVEDQAQRRTFEAGADELIGQPYDARQLLKRLANVPSRSEEIPLAEMRV